MDPVIFSNIWIASFAVILLCNLINSIPIDNYQDNSDLVYYLTDGGFKHENLSRYTRQTITTCRFPNNSFHTTHKLIGGTSSNAEPGDEVESFKILETSCKSGFKLNPIVENHSICINGAWTPPLTNCLRACPSLTSVNSTNVKCKWNEYRGNAIPLPNCLNAVEGTTAILSCNSLYEEWHIEQNPIRICREGKWAPPISECYPICGIKRPKGTANIINGTDAEPGDYPWQIGIYNIKKELICGGSILDNRIILSAAHCFTDYSGNVHPADNYFVGAGKYYQKYDDERDTFAQYSKILEIQIPERFKGLTNLQGFDIAVLILTNPLVISQAVLPVCIELNQESQALHLSLNKNGIVTGWGYTEGGGKLSDVLKDIIIPYIPYDECFHTVPENFRKFLTHDTICGGYINKEKSVCQGDSGGGLVFKKLNSDRHYVKGIVSVSPATEELVCDPNQYSLYTFVDKHIDFIRLVLLYNRRQQKIECEQDGCLMKKPPSLEDCNNSNDPICKDVKQGCQMPYNPRNGRYSVSGSNLQGVFKPGDIVPLYSFISLSCNIGYKAVPISLETNSTGSYCMGVWTPPPKTCAQMCSSLEERPSTRVKCRLNGIDLNNCMNPVEGTTAHISCEPLYEQKDLQLNPIRLCSHGTWDYAITYCLPSVCGEKGPKRVTNIVKNGVNVTKGDYPWQVAVYNEKTEFICGGSIINTGIVLSAAHCFTNATDGTQQPKENYHIVAGKYYRSYNDERDSQAQYSDIKSIHIPSSFRGLINFFESDIAVIILSTPFRLSPNVQPVCIDLDSDYDQPDLSTNGVVTGWGYTNEYKNEPDALKELFIPVVPYENCFDKVPKEFEKFVTFDKICAGYLEGPEAEVCRGDNGGPLAFPKTSGLTERYFVRGIVSTSPGSLGLSCDLNQYYGTFTSVARHVNFIRDPYNYVA